MRKKPVQQRSRLMVDSILDATARLIASDGLDAVTTHRVAEIAGISNGSLYQYFHDRDDLIEALLERVSNEAMRAFSSGLGSVPTAEVDVREMSRLALRMALAFMRSNALYPELIRNWHRLPVHRLFDPIEQYFMAVGSAYVLQHAGRYQAGKLQTRLYVVINSTIFTMIRFLGEDNPLLKEEDVIDCLADQVAASLAAETAGAVRSRRTSGSRRSPPPPPAARKARGPARR